MSPDCPTVKAAQAEKNYKNKQNYKHICVGVCVCTDIIAASTFAYVNITF